MDQIEAYREWVCTAFSRHLARVFRPHGFEWRDEEHPCLTGFVRAFGDVTQRVQISLQSFRQEHFGLSLLFGFRSESAEAIYQRFVTVHQERAALGKTCLFTLKDLARLGWEVTRSTLCGQIMACANVLAPLYRLMCDRARQSAALHADDTPVVLLAPRRTAHAWVYVGDADNPYTVFDLSVGRSQDAPAAFLQGYGGFVHADGFAGYNPVYAGGATHVGCWMHARRYFFDARLTDPERSHEALAWIRALYAVERDAKEKGLTGADLAAYRQRHGAPILTAFAHWLAEQVPRVLPKSEIGKAVTYATNQWPSLVVYTRDGRLTIDNGPAEQAIRPLAIGRRNWLHIAGDGGLRPTAVLLSLAASARRPGINPWAYLTHVLTELPARPLGAGLADLLPDGWARSQAGTSCTASY
jgi:transposase